MSWVGQYILDGHTPKRCDNILEWGRWMQSNDRHVGKTRVNGKYISTVFLGLDHNYYEDGTPILFETMIFDESKEGRERWNEEYQERYSTWEEAEKGHRKAVNYVTQRLKVVKNVNYSG